ncbi:fatty acid CoA ligase family protein [Rhabdobacter roseus]|uniref:Acyl-CoA synthetase (AMP-forming)/AMP-acid ligase II n=1 Tax=Rhabdobacter roseus TaxID=1655419 RepID=A0A840TKH5_9BACT|nr:AMP-binding protein [Rhabdobacter roseus]MBB5282307.1 acyl-CoA synthetase (AMP-forming)/AMP-acid ligase II [Rhabdobacter roseus]
MENAFNIVDLFYAAARQVPQQTAIIHRNRAVSFAELEQQVTDTARYFLHKGIRKGDRVLVFVPMSIDLYRVVLALFRMGATAVFLDEWVSKKRLEEACRVAQCRAFVGSWKVRLLALLSAETRKIPLKLGLHFSAQGTFSFPETTPDDPALITFTTGSTGVPKAAVRTHGLLQAQFQSLTRLIQPQTQTTDMPVLPIVLLINLGSGVTSVIADFNPRKPHTIKPGRIVRQLEAQQVRSLVASPFVVKEIARYLISQRLGLPQLQKIFTGGAPVFPTEAALYHRAFPEATTQVVYGSTEAEPISAIDVAELRQEKVPTQGLKVGKPAPETQVKIIGITDEALVVHSLPDLDALEVPRGQIGEIIVSGAHVLRDYLHNAPARQRHKIFVNDQCWHRTGDSGYLDAHGLLFLTGRCASLIPWEGELLSPFVYEHYFQTLPGVELGTLLLLQGTLTAFLELRDPAQKEAVRRQIEALEVPIREIVFVPKLPRDPRHHSKIDYERLRASFGESDC